MFRYTSGTVLAAALCACSSPLAAPNILQSRAQPESVTASVAKTTCTRNCLYVTERFVWQQFAPPYSADSAPVFSRDSKTPLSVAASAQYLAVSRTGSDGIELYKQPAGPAARVYATITTSGVPGFGAFDAHGNLWIPIGGAKVQEFKPPLSGTSKPAVTISKDAAGAVAAVADAYGNVYVVEDTGSSPPSMQLVRYSKPYPGTPMIMPLNGNAYGEALRGKTLAVTEYSQPGCYCSQLYVFTLPLTPNDGFTIGLGNGIPGAPAFDDRGAFFQPFTEGPVGGTDRIDVYTSLTASSNPAFSITKGITIPHQAAFLP